MFSLLRSLASNRRLLKDFVVRDLKARYVGSSMGFFWSVIFPIINLCVYLFVFRLVLKARWSDFQGPIEVALVMLGGIVVWVAFAETISRATNTLVENSNLIQKVVFPSEVLPLYLTISSIVNMLIGFPVVVLCVVWFAYLSPPAVDLVQPMRVIEVDGHREEVPAPIVLGERDGQPAHVGVTLARGWHESLSAPISFGGTAQLGVDYSCDLKQVSFPSGMLLVTICLSAIPDGEVEGPETIIVRLEQPEHAALGELSELQVTLEDGVLLAPGEEPAPPGPAFVPGDTDPAYHPLSIGLSVVCLPLLILLQLIFTVGLGYFLSTLNLFLRDTYHLVGVGITVWMFGTPIFYPGTMVQKEGYGILLTVNPMHWLIDSYRDVLLYGLWPEPAMLLRLIVVGSIVLFLGARFFTSQKRRFPDLL